MKTVSILVPSSGVLQSVADPQYCFSAVNEFMISAGLQPAFRVELVGIKKEVALQQGQYLIKADRTIHEVEESDLVIVPALFGSKPEAIRQNSDFIAWIIDRYNCGTEIASLCVGAFLLGATGLLDGKQCSTHWGFADEFREMYPDVNLQDGKIITDDGGIYTSGGANSYWNLLLYLVEKYAGREFAIMASKYFAIDIDRNSQAPYTIFRGQKSHGDDQIKEAQLFIENHIENRITVEELAEKVMLGRRSFERRFRKATGNSVMEYMKRVKMEAAKRHFENERKSISEVMMELGYSDTKAFRSAFRKVTGLSPSEYRNRFVSQMPKSVSGIPL